MSRVVEILLYALKPGSGGEFFDLMEQVSAPLHRRHGIDVVWHGRSLTDPDGYFLIRAFPDPAQLEAQQTAFYGSDDWRSGPRQSIVERIATATRVVVPMSDAAIEAIRSEGFQLAGG